MVDSDRSKRMCDQKYGKRYVVRAVTPAPKRPASSEKNQMPTRPAASRTYVRTFVSQKRETHGIGRVRGSHTCMANGTRPTHARSSNGSTNRPGGSKRCTASGSKLQC